VTPWLSIVGLGEDGLAGLSPAARGLVDAAEVLIGGERHLAMLPEDGRERLTWPSPLLALVDDILARRGQAVCVLATGDPLAYGIGSTLVGRVPIEEITIIPGASAFSLAAARLGWILAEVDCLTLHGRPLALLEPYIQPGAKLLLLSNGPETPAAVAARLLARGAGKSAMTALAHMGGSRESRISASAEDWGDPEVPALNTLAVDCRLDAGAPLLPRVPGLPDEAFRNDGQLTKREQRAVTLAALAPVAGQLLWDVGAGCGSIAIEWMRAAPRARAIAVEHNKARIAMIAENAEALGAPQLQIVEGKAPPALEGLEPPDAVFLGGGLSTPGLVDACWAALKPGGRLVANAVTLEGEQVLTAWQSRAGGRLTRIAVARAEAVGAFRGWRPLMPVTQLSAVKP
jgi:precorrin-6Y C5,15-methyltransferase (decarboxylating)